MIREATKLDQFLEIVQLVFVFVFVLLVENKF